MKCYPVKSCLVPTSPIIHHEARVIKHAWQKKDSFSIFVLIMKVMKHGDQFR